MGGQAGGAGGEGGLEEGGAINQTYGGLAGGRRDPSPQRHAALPCIAHAGDWRSAERWGGVGEA